MTMTFDLAAYRNKKFELGSTVLYKNKEHRVTTFNPSSKVYGIQPVESYDPIYGTSIRVSEKELS